MGRSATMLSMRLKPRSPRVCGLAIFAALTLSACSPTPVRTDLPAVWLPSPNQDGRRPDFVILHHTGDDTQQSALATLTNPLRRVSAHYLVARDGALYQLVDEQRRAWHAGAGRWGMQSDLNSASIGIEMDNNGAEDYPEVQVVTLLALLQDISRRQHIPPANYLGHGDVAPGRKSDPGMRFPWKRLADEGFGLWCKEPYPEVPASFDVRDGLAALGYDGRRFDASLKAFRIHFRTLDSDAPPDAADAALILCLLRQREK